MKTFFKETGIVLGGLIVPTLLAGLVLYPIGMNKIARTYPNSRVETVKIPTDADAITRGRHISVIWACTKCHGGDLSGKLLTNDPEVVHVRRQCCHPLRRARSRLLKDCM